VSQLSQSHAWHALLRFHYSFPPLRGSLAGVCCFVRILGRSSNPAPLFPGCQAALSGTNPPSWTVGGIIRGEEQQTARACAPRPPPGRNSPLFLFLMWPLISLIYVACACWAATGEVARALEKLSIKTQKNCGLCYISKSAPASIPLIPTHVEPLFLFQFILRRCCRWPVCISLLFVVWHSVTCW
jgi:hypothetical protein